MTSHIHCGTLTLDTRYTSHIHTHVRAGMWYWEGEANYTSFATQMPHSWSGRRVENIFCRQIQCDRHMSAYVCGKTYSWIRGKKWMELLLLLPLLLLLLLPLQPAVGFGLSNNTSPSFPIYHHLSPSSHSHHLKISFYFFCSVDFLFQYFR